MPKPKPQPITGQPFRDDDPLFTVIVTDYEPSVPREYLRRKMACLAAQTCGDFEVLVYHDGPKAQSYAEDMAGAPMHQATEFIVTPKWIGDWGHSSRDLGIRAARGRWIIHTNADNIFYPNLIAELKAVLTEPQGWGFVAYKKMRLPFGLELLAKWLDRNFDTDYAMALEPRIFESREPQILIYSIVMRGMLAYKYNYVRVPALADRQGIIFSGLPVRHGSIDAMQLVMQRALWLAEGGWHDKAMDSDAQLYLEFIQKYRLLSVPSVLGEHW